MMPQEPPKLSKSRFLAGIQCPLKLWYQCYHPDPGAEVSPTQRAIFCMGHEVGKTATRLYPQGIFIEEDCLNHVPASSRRSGPTCA